MSIEITKLKHREKQTITTRKTKNPNILIGMLEREKRMRQKKYLKRQWSNFSKNSKIHHATDSRISEKHRQDKERTN